MDHMKNNNLDPETRNGTYEINDSAKRKNEANPIRQPTIKMDNTLNDITNLPSSAAFESYSTQFMNNLPAQNTVNNSSQNFVPHFGLMTNDQYRSLIRLVHLFPQLHAATLKGALELCNYDSIQTIDSILYALQYRRYLDAKNQGFPLDCNLSGTRILLLPSFLGNRSTNPTVYEHLCQDSAYFNNVPPGCGGDSNNFEHPNCYTSSSGVADTSPTKSHPIPQSFSSYQFPNETGTEHNFKVPGNCSLPPFSHLAQYVPPRQNNENSIRPNMAKCTPSFTVSNNSDKENAVDGSVQNSKSSSVVNSGRQSEVNESKKTVKPAKVKRLIKSKQVIPHAKVFNKKQFKIPKLTESKNVEEKSNSSGPDHTESRLMDTINDCIIVESTSRIEIQSVIDSHKASQCPLGDKDCNEIFQAK